MTGLYDVEVVSTSDIDTNAIIGYAAIHEGLTNEMIDSYADYPSREEMAQWLEDHNIGYDPMKNKHYDWKKKITHKKKDIEKAWLACKLSKNVGDISKVEHLPSCDLLTYSFPCQSISISGKLEGFKKNSGTRSSLVHEVMRLLVDYKDRDELPKYLLMENVKNLVSRKFIDDFNEIISLLDDIGYNTYWKVLNGKECGVCQNRERVFALSIRKDIDNGKFEFPKPFDTGIRLKDILLNPAPEKYYITNDRAKALIKDLVMNGKIVDNKETVTENPTDRQTDRQVPIDLTIADPRAIEYANCLTAREDRGIAVVSNAVTSQ